MRCIVLASVCLAPINCLGASAYTLPPGCNIVCGETYFRDGLATAQPGGHPSPSLLPDYKAQFRAIVDATSEDNRHLLVGGEASRYLGKAVGLAGDAGLASEGLGAAAIEASSQLLESLGEHLVTLYDERVAYALATHADRQLTQQILAGTKPLDQELLDRFAHTLADPTFLNGLPKETKDAIDPVRDRVTHGYLSKIFSQGFQSQQALSALGNDQARIAASISQLRITTEQTRNALARLNSVAEMQLEATNKGLADQRAWNSETSRTLSPVQQLRLVDMGLIDRTDIEKIKLRQLANADQIVAEASTVVSGMKVVADGLRVLGEVDMARTVDIGGNLVMGAASFAAGYATMNPMMMAQGGIAVIGSIKAFGSKPKPDPEISLLFEVLKEVRELRLAIAKNHREEMNALRTISLQIYDLNGVVLNGFDSTLFAMSQLDAGIQQLQSAYEESCKLFLADMKSKLGTEHLRFASMDAAAEWFNRKDHQDFNECRKGLKQIPSESHMGHEPTKQLVPNYLRFAYYAETIIAPGGSNPTLNSDASQNLQNAKYFIDKTLVPIAEYAANYLRPVPYKWHQWIRSDILSLGAVASSEPLPQSDGAVSAMMLMPAHEALLVDSMRISPYVNAAESIAPIVDLATADGGHLKLPTSKTIQGCISDGSCSRVLSREDGGSVVNGLEQVVNTAIAQETLISGAPILKEVVRTLTYEILPAYAVERSGGAEKPLTALLQAALPNPGDVLDHDKEVRLGTCRTKNKIYDTLCLVWTNPWLAENAIALLVYTNGTAKYNTESPGRYLKAASGNAGEYASSLQDFVGYSGRLNYSSYLIIPPNKRLGANLWGLELPRLRIPTYPPAQDASSSKADDTSEVMIPLMDCWASPDRPLPDLGTYIGDARYSGCIMLPVDIRPDVRLVSRPALRNDSSADKGASQPGSPSTHHTLLLHLRQRLRDIRWSIADPESIEQRNALGGLAALSATSAPPNVRSKAGESP